MNVIRDFVIDAYTFVFARKIFYKFNRVLHILSGRGIGILNYKNIKVSGEYHFLNSLKFRCPSDCVTVFDVGANRGNYSSMIRAVFPRAHIYSFEPHPKTFVELNKAAQVKGFHAHNYAVGECKAKLKLYDYAGDAGCGSEHASMFQDVIETIHKGAAQSFNVDVITIDAFVKEHQIESINLLKIDTEGNELNVLKGASECIRRNMIDMIHFEFNEMNVVSRVFMKDFFDLLQNFKFYRMLSDGLVPLVYTPLTCEIFAYQNVVAIRDVF